MEVVIGLEKEKDSTILVYMQLLSLWFRFMFVNKSMLVEKKSPLIREDGRALPGCSLHTPVGGLRPPCAEQACCSDPRRPPTGPLCPAGIPRRGRAGLQPRTGAGPKQPGSVLSPPLRGLWITTLLDLSSVCEGPDLPPQRPPSPLLPFLL